MGTIGTKPLAQFADWKLASDLAELKGEAYLLQKELIRKDAFAYQLVSPLWTHVRIMPTMEYPAWGGATLRYSKKNLD